MTMMTKSSLWVSLGQMHLNNKETLVLQKTDHTNGILGKNHPYPELNASSGAPLELLHVCLFPFLSS